MIATRPVHQVRSGDKIHGISVNKVIHKGTVQSVPFPALKSGQIIVPIECEDHGPEELVTDPDKLANVERRV